MIIETIEDLITLATSQSLKEHVYSNVELKEGWQLEYGKRLSAAANRVSGDIHWIVIGIADNGVIVGEPEAWAKATEAVISQQVNGLLRPSQACQAVQCHSLPRGWIISIMIRNPGVVTKWRDKAYAAIGTTSKELSPEEMMALAVTLPGLADKSAQPAVSEYSEELIRDYCKVVGERQSEAPYRELQTLSPQELLARLGVNGTVTSRILFGEAKFRLVLYESEGKPTENIEMSGLFRILREDFILQAQDWARTHSTHDHVGYPVEALREGLANAVAHAAYVEKDGDVIIELFPDRIAIGNLAQPECRYFANRWFSTSHHTVNRLLAEVLRMSRHVDEVGWGKNAIFRESIKSGKRAPRVDLQKAGHLDRWVLTIYSGPQDERHERLLRRLREKYPDEKKALIAYALILWRDKPVKEIQNYIDGESAKHFAEVLSDAYGPIFYFEAEDRIILRRWARILLGEGKDSKTHTPAEEADLFRIAYKIQVQHYGGIITPKRLRDLGDLGETGSAKSLSSSLLSKWSSAGHIAKIRTGMYRFQAQEVDDVDLVEVLTRKRS